MIEMNSCCAEPLDLERAQAQRNHATRHLPITSSHASCDAAGQPEPPDAAHRSASQGNVNPRAHTIPALGERTVKKKRQKDCPVYHGPRLTGVVFFSAERETNRVMPTTVSWVRQMTEAVTDAEWEQMRLNNKDLGL